MLQFYTAFCLFTIAIAYFRSALAAPSPPIDVTTRILSGIIQNETTEHETSSSSSMMHPHFITIERLESLLRRAGEIFRPLMQTQSSEQQESINMAPIPLQQLQPPTVHPYNFYLPPFEHEVDHVKLDEKSRSMESFTPPPLNNEKEETNYYASKPKKLPKKFNAAEKLVNMKWLNAFERDALADANGQIPKAVYLVNDERNRINFDDSFFAVDMHVRTPTDNNPHKESKPIIGNNDGEQDFLNQSESEDGEDLVAAPAAHVSQMSYDYSAKKKSN